MTQSCCALRDGAEPIKVRILYWYILTAFPRIYRSPTLHEMQKDLHFSKDLIIQSLEYLERKGALRFDPTTHRILDAYPYSGAPTRHHVRLNRNGEVYSMCAIDAFYIPFLTGQDVTIRSRCYFCRYQIEISVVQHSVSRADPQDTVVWNSASSYDCPKTNFFCSEEHLLDWREKAPDEQGQVYSLNDALNAGRRAADNIRKSSDGMNDVLWATADELVCYCREVPKFTILAAIARGASSVADVSAETTACTGEWCKDTNPRKRCCCAEIESLIEVYSQTGSDAAGHVAAG